MRKIFLFVAAVFCTTMMYAVPAPTNVHWDGTTLKWELPDLTNDSVYKGISIRIFTSTGVSLSGIGTGVTEGYDFSEYMYHGRTYYAIIHSNAGIPDNNNNVSSADTKSPDYTVPGVKDTLEFSPVSLNASGYVSWPYAYQKVRATLQKQNGLEWEDKDSYTSSQSWNQGWSFGTFTEAGTYRAIVDFLQDEDVVKRGITDNIVVEETFTVTFNANGLDPFTAIDPVVVAKNSIINAPTIHDNYRNQKDGHFFYWSSDEEGNDIWEFGVAKVTANTTLYAQWKEYPALNPVWDVDTCRWTLEEKYNKAFYNLVIKLQTENGNEVSSSGISTYRTSLHSDYLFPGRNYKFNVRLADFNSNDITATSELHTTAGVAEILPLQNMHVSNSATCVVAWDAPSSGVYRRHGVLYRWDKGISDWEQIATHDDSSPTWTNTYVQLGEALDNAEYYRIHCQLRQGEYVIYEGEIFFGTNPATGIDDTAVDAKAVKRIVDGQFFIERDGKTFNAQGVEVK